MRVLRSLFFRERLLENTTQQELVRKCLPASLRVLSTCVVDPISAAGRVRWRVIRIVWQCCAGASGIPADVLQHLGDAHQAWEFVAKCRHKSLRLSEASPAYCGDLLAIGLHRAKRALHSVDDRRSGCLCVRRPTVASTQWPELPNHPATPTSLRGARWRTAPTTHHHRRIRGAIFPNTAWCWAISADVLIHCFHRSALPIYP